MKNTFKTCLFPVALLCLGSVAISGCATTAVGNVAAKEPPRLVAMNSDKATAIDEGKSVAARWDRPGAFGPVPAELKVMGDSSCQRAGFARAAGYHPQAIGLDGRMIAGGGYYCG